MSSDKRGSVGAELKKARLRQRRKFASITNATRIREHHLAALEENRFSELPGFTYSIGFVRTYARYLKLDVENLAARFRAEYSLEKAPTPLHFPEPIKGSRIPAWPFLAMASIAFSVIYFGWFHQFEQTSVAESGVMPLPQHLAALVESPDTSSQIKPMTVPIAVPEAETEEEPEGIVDNIRQENPTARISEIYSGQPSRIRIEAEQEVWLRILDHSKQVIVDQVLAAGEGFSPPALDGLTLTTGNAGVLDIYVDGHRIRNLGARGSIIRGVALDPERLKERTEVATRLGGLY